MIILTDRERFLFLDLLVFFILFWKYLIVWVERTLKKDNKYEYICIKKIRGCEQKRYNDNTFTYDCFSPWKCDFQALKQNVVVSDKYMSKNICGKGFFGCGKQWANDKTKAWDCLNPRPCRHQIPKLNLEWPR